MGNRLSTVQNSTDTDTDTNTITASNARPKEWIFKTQVGCTWDRGSGDCAKKYKKMSRLGSSGLYSVNNMIL